MSKVEEISIIDEPYAFKNIETFVDADPLRQYVKELIQEVSNYAQTHPPVLKGESVSGIVRETDRLKKQCEQVEKKTNDVRA